MLSFSSFSSFCWSVYCCAHCDHPVYGTTVHPIRCTAPNAPAESGASTGSGAQCTGYGTTAPDPVHCTECPRRIRCGAQDLERSAPDMAPLNPIRRTAPDVAAPTSGAPDMTTESGAVTGSGAQRTGYGTTEPDPVHRTGCGSSHIRCTGYDYHIRCTGSDTVISGARHRIKPISGALDLACGSPWIGLDSKSMPGLKRVF